MDDIEISALDGHLRAQLERLQAAELAGSTSKCMEELSRTRAIIEVSRHIIQHAHLVRKSRCIVKL